MKDSEEDDFFVPIPKKRGKKNKMKVTSVMEDSATDFEGWQVSTVGLNAVGLVCIGVDYNLIGWYDLRLDWNESDGMELDEI